MESSGGDCSLADIRNLCSKTNTRGGTLHLCETMSQAGGAVFSCESHVLNCERSFLHLNKNCSDCGMPLRSLAGEWPSSLSIILCCEYGG